MTTDAGPLTTQHTVLGTPIGDLTVVREGGLLTGLYFPHHWYKPDPATFGPRNDRGFEGVAGQLEEYLAGNRTVFDLPLKPRGTEFQLRVWGLIAEQAARGELAADGDVSSFVHVDDAAGAAVQALEWPTGAVNVCDDVPAAGREWVPVFCRAVGAPDPAVSTADGRHGWARGASNEYARKQLHWTPDYPSWREGFATL